MKLVIGYGNPLRGDDGVGWWVAEATAACLPVEVLTTHQLTPELSATISKAKQLVFVDAAATGTPGQVNVLPLSVSDQAAIASAFDSHLVLPDQLLGMAARLFGHAPEAYLVTIAGESFALSEELSPPVAAAVPEAVRRIAALLAP